MKNGQRKTSALTLILFVAAIILLAGSGIGAARAAAQYRSMEYQARLAMQDIGVALNENGETVATDKMDSGVLLTNLIPEGEKFAPNKKYAEELTVVNTGTIDEYVRVVLDMYWLDQNGQKMTTLSPELIKLNILEENGWMIDPNSSYVKGEGEQLVLVYNTALASGETSKALSDTLAVDGKIAKSVKQVREGNVITTIYKYDGVSFAISAEVDAIQTHNAADAAKSAWGMNITENNGTISLN